MLFYPPSSQHVYLSNFFISWYCKIQNSIIVKPIQSRNQFTALMYHIMTHELIRNQTLILQTFLAKRTCTVLESTIGTWIVHKMTLPAFFVNSEINILLLSEIHLTDKYDFIIPGYFRHDGKGRKNYEIFVRNHTKPHFNQSLTSLSTIWFVDG